MVTEKINRGMHTDLPQMLNLENPQEIESLKEDSFSSNHKNSKYTGVPPRVNVRDDTTYTSSSTEVYKMTAHSGKVKRKPSHIEFNLYRKPKPFSFFTMRRKLKEKQQIAAQMRKTHKNFKNGVQFKNYSTSISTNNLNKSEDEKIAEAHVDLYFFDQGTSEYLCTTDYPPHLMTDKLSQQTTDCATKFWAEVYGTINVAFAFFVAFFIQTLRFFLYSLIRPLSIGLIQIISDYFVKPLLTVIFNGILLPPLKLLQNILNTVCDLIEPIARAFDSLLKPVANIIQSIRLVDIRNEEKNPRKETI